MEKPQISYESVLIEYEIRLAELQKDLLVQKAYTKELLKQIDEKAPAK